MKKMGIAVALLALATPGSLSAQTYDKDAVVRTFTQASVLPVLKQLNIEVTGTRKSGKFDVIDIKFANGLNGELIPNACVEDGRCVGLNLLARWDRDTRFTQADDIAYMSAFNNEYDFTKAGVDGDGLLYLQRYVIADHGVSQANLLEEFSNFQTLVQRFDEHNQKR